MHARILGPLALPLLALASAAQTPTSLTHNCGLARVDGQLWAVGPRYKAHFDGSGVEFTPSLGRAAPRNYPITLRALDVSRGGKALNLSPATPQAEGRRVVLERGAVRECYEVGNDGLQQSFVLERLPEGDGDLVVRVQLSTELTASRDGEGLRFELPGVGGCRLGGVTGIDATGRRAAGTLSLRGDQIELRVPRSFVRDAALPLTVDPLLGNVFAVVATSSDDEDPHVAFDNSWNRYLVVWRHVVSTSDSDIQGQLVDGFGNLIGGRLPISFTTIIESEPSVADFSAHDAFVVSYQSSGEVMGRAVDASTGTLGAIRTLAGGSGIQHHADLGGEATNDPSAPAVCVFKNDASNSIDAVSVTVNAGLALSITLPVTILAGGAFPLENPRISRSNGAGGRFGVAFQIEFGGGANSDIYFAILSKGGTPIGNPYKATSASTDEEQPDVDGDGTNWVLAYQSLASINNYDIVAQGFAFALGGIVPTGPVATVESGARSQATASVLWLGETYLVGFIEQVVPNTVLWNPVLRSIAMFDCAPCEGRFPLVSPQIQNGTPRGVSTRAGGSTINDDALVVFEATDPSSAFVGDIEATLWHTQDGIATDVGGGCGQGGTQFTSCAIVGNGQFGFDLHDSIANSLTFLVLATQRMDLACGSCRLVPDPWRGVVFNTTTDFAGRARFAVPIPPLAGLRSLPFYAQWGTTAATSPACLAMPIDLSPARRLILE